MHRRFGLSIASAALALSLVVHPAGAKSPKGLSPEAKNKLVEAVLEAHGGRKALQAVRSLKVVGRLKAVLRKDQGAGTVYFQHPDRLFSDNRYKRSREVRILNGPKGWIKADGAFEAAPPGVMLGMRYSLITYRLPLELADQRQNLAYLGQVEQHGKLFDVLELAYTKALRVRVYVETDSKRMAQVAGYISVGDNTIVLSRVLGDYREVAGVAYPFHQLYYSGSTLIAEKRVESVKANTTLPEGLFSPE